MEPVPSLRRQPGLPARCPGSARRRVRFDVARLGLGGREHLLVDLQVGPDLLCVVVVFERLQELADFGAVRDACERAASLDFAAVAVPGVGDFVATLAGWSERTAGANAKREYCTGAW